MATRIVPKTELRDRIRKELADLGDDTLLVTERGQPLAVAVSVQRWNQLQERLEDLEDAVAVLDHRLSRRAGRPAESVFDAIETEEVDVPRPARKTG
ncbi:MAG: type II toxin-antitoxin system prevent-host-death family antitoxin [Actinomycetota bacterium]